MIIHFKGVDVDLDSNDINISTINNIDYKILSDGDIIINGDYLLYGHGNCDMLGNNPALISNNDWLNHTVNSTKISPTYKNMWDSGQILNVLRKI